LDLLPAELDLPQASCQVASHDSYSVTTPKRSNFMCVLIVIMNSLSQSKSVSPL
jgi:hypothetical protein